MQLRPYTLYIKTIPETIGQHILVFFVEIRIWCPIVSHYFHDRSCDGIDVVELFWASARCIICGVRPPKTSIPHLISFVLLPGDGRHSTLDLIGRLLVGQVVYPLAQWTASSPGFEMARNSRASLIENDIPRAMCSVRYDMLWSSGRLVVLS